MKSSLYLLFLTCFIFSSVAMAANTVVVVPLGGAEHYMYWQDQWTVDTSYKIGDGVQYNGSSYVCVEAHQSTSPNSPPSMYWNILALEGATGATGTQGPPGDTGAPGSQGPPGDAGFDGADGEKGPQGAAGTDGDKGEKGSTGIQGIKGGPGAAGPQGPASPVGQAKGLSIGNEVTHTIGGVDYIWLDRNLGASQVATSSTDADAFGDLYQWGRDVDGHESRTSRQSNILSSSDTPGHDNFILSQSSPFDWRSSPNDALWQGVNGINNPCPGGFRLPTHTEWHTELSSWEHYSSIGAFASPLKLVEAGHRSYINGAVTGTGFYGYYWSSTVQGTTSSLYLYIETSTAHSNGEHRAAGYSVRCIKD